MTRDELNAWAQRWSKESGNTTLERLAEVAAAVLDLAKSAEAAEAKLAEAERTVAYWKEAAAQNSGQARAAEARAAEAERWEVAHVQARLVIEARLAEAERELDGERSMDAAIRLEDARQLERAQSALAAAEAREKALRALVVRVRILPNLTRASNELWAAWDAEADVVLAARAALAVPPAQGRKDDAKEGV
jgi:hypothetical protein